MRHKAYRVYIFIRINLRDTSSIYFLLQVNLCVIREIYFLARGSTPDKINVKDEKR